MLKKLLFICLMIMSISSISFAKSSEDLRVALVYGQYSAEISCDDEFTVKDFATGKVSTIPEGKYFLNVKDGKLPWVSKSLVTKLPSIVLKASLCRKSTSAVMQVRWLRKLKGINF